MREERAVTSDVASETTQLSRTMERRLGALSFIAAVHRTHRPGYDAPERTLKSFLLQEAESFSREAKAEWCAMNSHAAVNLQHDGVIVALRSGTSVEEAVTQMQHASETALGYAQGCEIKAPELPPGVVASAPVTLDAIAAALRGARSATPPPPVSTGCHDLPARRREAATLRS